MKRNVIALLLVLSLLLFPQLGAVAASAEELEADTVFPADVSCPIEAAVQRTSDSGPARVSVSNDKDAPVLDQVRITGVQEYDNAYAVLALVNARRAENGASPLVMDQNLLSAAMLRAGECALLFSHTRPNGSLCFSACPSMFGENIAAGQGTPAAVMQSWMNSEGHRNNILNANYHTIGIGCFLIGGMRFWVQCFGFDTAAADCAKPANATVSQVIDFCTEPMEDMYGSYEFKLSVTAEKTVLNLGDSTRLTVKMENTGFNYFICPIDPEGLRWTSSDTDVAVVDAGAVRAVGAGSAEITAAGLNGILSKTTALDVRSPACSSGHKWDSGSVLTEPTCTEPGTLRQRCKVCRMKKDRELPALGHVWRLTETLAGESIHSSAGRYTCDRCQETKEARLCTAEIFTDVPGAKHWSHDAIDWAYFNGYTSGTSATTFSPNASLTRGQVVTFLYAFRGRPQTAGDNPFRDIKTKDYFYYPVLWAVENNVTGGTSATTFSPDRTCVRAEIVTFLWAAAGRPEPQSTENPFLDVNSNDYFYKPVLWAVENYVTGGVDAAHFKPDLPCTRAQMVVLLQAAAPVLSDS